MPSTTPSAASHEDLTALATRFRSALLKACDRMRLPEASCGAMALNWMVFHIAATVAPLDTRMAGAPAVMASK
ncbi:hypothetical protein D3C72_2349670 [compost metagenome]